MKKPKTLVNQLATDHLPKAVMVLGAGALLWIGTAGQLLIDANHSNEATMQEFAEMDRAERAHTMAATLNKTYGPALRSRKQ